MLLKRLICFALLVLPYAASANDPLPDPSKADSDGPYVLYRGKNVIVKSVERLDTSVVARTQVYNDKNMAVLTCRIPETGDKFSFKLREDLAIEPDRYEMPARLLALSDIEGDFEAFKIMLLSAKVIDGSFNWTFGDGHLVLLGDYFDRGLNVTECLWLAYKLENEAEAAGGKVHFILGNHEILNLQGSSQYVRKKYLENANLIGEEYHHLYDNNSELGRWLRTKNAVERIGNYVFCHGGISPELARYGLKLSDINKVSRKYLGKPYESIKDEDGKVVFDMKTGIFWYRNMAKSLLTNKEVDEIMQYAAASYIVLAHTLQPDITSLYDGRVICIDLYHEENLRQGFVKTLWIENGISFALDSKGVKSSLLRIEFRPSPPKSLSQGKSEGQ